MIKTIYYAFDVLFIARNAYTSFMSIHAHSQYCSIIVTVIKFNFHQPRRRINEKLKEIEKD